MAALDVFSLLTFPITSSGAFTSVSGPRDAASEDGSASPPRKTRRLEGEGAIPSSSRITAKQTGPIKIRVTEFTAPRPNENLARSHLSLVTQAIRAILTPGESGILPASYEKIFNSCRYTVAVANNGEGLYNTLKIELERSLNKVFKYLVDAAGSGTEDWISTFVKTFRWFETQVELLKSLLTYEDQLYILSNKHLLDIRSLAFDMFGQRILADYDVRMPLEQRIQDWSHKERTLRLEDTETRDQLRQLVHFLMVHNKYVDIYENSFVEMTRDFYSEESTQLAESMKQDARAFLKHCMQRLEEELLRSKALLPPGSWALLQTTTERALLTGRLEWIAKDTLKRYAKDDVKLLGATYQLYSRVDGKKILCTAFKDRFQASVREIVLDASREEDMVPNLLSLKELADITISEAFVDEVVSTAASTSALVSTIPNMDFVHALGDAFANGFKARRNKPAEMIAKFIDKLMRKGQGTSSDSEFEALLKATLGLYRYTDDKDVFRTFYHRQLAKRLLLDKSASIDFEKSMLKNMKDNYDPEIGMATDMFKDLTLSHELMNEHQGKRRHDQDRRKLAVMVLQQSAWPFGSKADSDSPDKKSATTNVEVELPGNMQSALSEYEAFYKEKHSNRVLTWQHSLGTVTLTARFERGTKELSVSLFQAVVLLLFNNADQLSLGEILAQTGLEDGELRRTLQSLACGKKKVLRKLPPGRDVNDGDTFRFNAAFEDERAKIHINSIQVKVTPEESRRTQLSIEGDRKHYLDAAIVRIMKAKKELPYEQLKMLTIDAMKNHFKPPVEVIKQRIDYLVENEYLERSKTDKNTFLYVA